MHGRIIVSRHAGGHDIKVVMDRCDVTMFVLIQTLLSPILMRACFCGVRKFSGGDFLTGAYALRFALSPLWAFE